MRKGVLVLVAVLVLVLSVGAFAFQNEPEGFRGLKWGDPPTEDMEFSIDVGGRTIGYILPNDKMFLGNVSLYMVGYMFYENRFVGAAMYFKGEDNYDLLETICKQRYGEEEADEGFYEIKWIGQKSFIMLNYDFAEEEGNLSVNSTLIAMEKMRAEEKEETEKAEGDW